jgi:hypothetical protein
MTSYTHHASKKLPNSEHQKMFVNSIEEPWEYKRQGVLSVSNKLERL